MMELDCLRLHAFFEKQLGVKQKYIAEKNYFEILR